MMLLLSRKSDPRRATGALSIRDQGTGALWELTDGSVEEGDVLTEGRGRDPSARGREGRIPAIAGGVHREGAINC
eukprot:9701133-Alexandrium_andersonii.AAC.1